MSKFHIEMRDPALAERGWKGLTPDEERQFLHDLLGAIREANESGEAKPVDDILERWWRHGILAEAGTLEEGLARAREARKTQQPMTAEEFEEALAREVEAQSASTS